MANTVLLCKSIYLLSITSSGAQPCKLGDKCPLSCCFLCPGTRTAQAWRASSNKVLTDLKQQDETGSNKCDSVERPGNLVDLALPLRNRSWWLSLLMTGLDSELPGRHSLHVSVKVLPGRFNWGGKATVDVDNAIPWVHSSQWRKAGCEPSISALPRFLTVGVMWPPCSQLCLATLIKPGPKTTLLCLL